MPNSRLNRRQLQTIVKGALPGLSLFILSACRETAPAAAPAGGSDVVLGIIAFFLFLTVLIFAGYKAFSPMTDAGDEQSRAEQRARVAAFFIGILITVIVIAADSAGRSMVSVSGLLGFAPWYILTLLGVIFGFALAIASYVASRYRPTSGYEFVILVLSACGSLGLYLAFSASGLRHSVLAGISAILVGLLFFRMLFPASPDSEAATG